MRMKKRRKKKRGLGLCVEISDAIERFLQMGITNLN